MVKKKIILISFFKDFKNPPISTGLNHFYFSQNFRLIVHGNVNKYGIQVKFDICVFMVSKVLSLKEYDKEKDIRAVLKYNRKAVTRSHAYKSYIYQKT